ncbi:MAG TPA: hypothetical protein VMA34_11450 [Terracidiphilus sp.]|nr:hypothetical protein [Terracidiphilus sp.]
MKRSLAFAFLLVLITIPASASERPQTVNFPETVQIGSTPVAAGSYKLTWTGAGSNVEVAIKQHDKTIATFPAKLVEGTNSPGITTDSKGGAEILLSIQLSHESLVLDGAGASSSGQ